MSTLKRYNSEEQQEAISNKWKTIHEQSALSDIANAYQPQTEEFTVSLEINGNAGNTKQGAKKKKNPPANYKNHA